MLRLVDRLSVELKGELGMASLEDVGIKVLVACDARICAHIKTSQIADSGCNPRSVSPIFSGVPAQPPLCCAVTTFAGNAFIRVRGRREPRRRDRLDRLKWGMTDRAAAAVLRSTQ